MPKYFYDTEFIEDGKTIDLISIGIVCSDGREYYKQNIAFFERALYNPRDTPKWIVENVFPHLSTYSMDWCDRTVMRAEISVFMNPAQYGTPELWGYYSAYDHVAFCQLFGTMMDLPTGFPMYTRDIKQWCDQLGNPLLPQQQEQGEHNALHDARHNRVLWKFLHQFEQEQGGVKSCP